MVGNTPTGDAILWSALSLMTLLAGTAIVLFSFGKFNFLGWKGRGEHIHPQMTPGMAAESQKATIKYFVVVALLFLVQVLVGGATAHYRADPGSFYGIDLSSFFPGNVFRTWHLQLAIFWIATGYIAGGLFLATSLGGREPKGQIKWINLLFVALVIVVFGSLLGEMLGVYQLLGKLWFWFGHQGWEYLDLGRAWQILLAIGLIIWLVLIFRGSRPARKNPEEREISTLFLLAALAIPLFYLPAMFFTSTTHFTVVDNWRFWIIHLWVEGFFELFVTTMVAVLFYKLGMVTRHNGNPGHLLRCDSLPRGRNHRHGASLVLDRTVKYHHGLCRNVLRHGGRPADLADAGCLGLHQAVQGKMRHLRQRNLYPAQVDVLLHDGCRILEFCRCGNIWVSHQPAHCQLL